MWGILVGLVIGALQVLALRILGKMILGDKLAAKALGAVLLIVKIAVIVLILYLIANVSLTHLLWTAGGMLIGMTAALAVIMISGRAKAAAQGGDNGKDNSHV